MYLVSRYGMVEFNCRAFTFPVRNTSITKASSYYEIPVESGVRFAEVTLPAGLVRVLPPAKVLPSIFFPLTADVWQSSQPDRLNRYFPHFGLLDVSGSATLSVSGSGALRIRYF